MPATSEGVADIGLGVDRLRAKLLGPFFISLGDRVAGPWDRPSARRLCQLVMVNPGLHISRQAAQEALFPNLGQPVATRELYKALSMARAAVSVLGATGAGLLRANRTHIWVDPACPVEIDFLLQADALRQALLTEAGTERDDRLVAALAEEGTLLEGEPVAEWAVRAREQLEWSRQEARQALARDRPGVRAFEPRSCRAGLGWVPRPRPHLRRGGLGLGLDAGLQRSRAGKPGGGGL